MVPQGAVPPQGPEVVESQSSDLLRRVRVLQPKDGPLTILQSEGTLMLGRSKAVYRSPAPGLCGVAKPPIGARRGG